MIEIAHLIAVADAYQAAVPVEDKTLSFRVFGDSKKLGALRAGADITTQRFNAALKWFEANWPDGAVWPGAVDRPTGEVAA
jgi:hypothetical protein